MGKILFPSGSKNVPVGETIAVLAEEGDDLSKLEVPKDLAPEKQNIPKDEGAAPAAPAAPESAPASSSSADASAAAAPAAHHIDLDHSKPMFASVARL